MSKGKIMFGIFKDNKKEVSIEDLRKQASVNNKDAQYQLGLAYYRGTRVKKDIHKANYWIEKSSDIES